MARKPSERRHATENLEDINLTPIMSILVILIPMLIFAFSFIEIALQQVAAPKMGPPKPKQADEKKPLQLTIVVNDAGFVLKQQADFEEPDVVIPLKEQADVAVTQPHLEYDYARLYSELMKKKKAYSEERTINLAADFHIPWHILARTIDAARVQLVESAYDDLVQYAQAKVKFTDGVPEPLFDTVVFMVDPDQAK
ncbi:MAG: biopolymer transporter ExbD [Myxococcales bacterium]|nr:biopolymer transporter ExbD [Myxococcales bacterium]